MKIVCENCSAKYSIADEKVRGKVFKIRCKKCGESIVVKGDAPQAAPAAEPAPPPMPAAPPPSDDGGDVETKVFDYSGYQEDDKSNEALWHIVIDGQQQGPYTSGQIEEYLEAGSLDPEMFIWREGFDDWLPIKDVAELNKGGAPAPVAAPEAPAPQASGGLFDAEPTAPASGGGLFDAEPAAPASGGGGLFDAEPAAAAPDNPGLFGSDNQAAASPFDSGGGLFGGSDSPAESGGDDVFSSAAAPAATGGLFNAESDDATANAGDGLFGGASEGGADLFGDAGSDDAGDNLFGGAEEPDPGPRVSAEDALMTGQRHENSVLFSLSNLQAIATTPAASTGGDDGGGGTFGAAPTGMATPAAPQADGSSEASGLIDIRSLASSISVTEKDGSLDDIISMGGGGFAPSLGAPVLAATNDGMSTGLKIGLIGGAVALAAIIVVVLVVVLGPKEDTKSAQQIALLQKQLSEMAKTGGNQADMDALKNELLKAKEEEGKEEEAPADTASAGKEDSKPESESSSKSSKSSSRRSSSSKSSSKSPSSSSKASSSKSKASNNSLMGGGGPSSSKSSSKKKGGSDALDDLLGGSLSGPKKGGSSSKKTSSSKPSSSSSSSGGGGAIKASLDRGDVQKGMGSVAGAVKRCSQGQHGTVTLQVVIGTTGRVSSANPTGAFAGTPVGNCAARAVRRAKFPRSKKTLKVKYPFKL
jgi:predicted Zn finger-like uncharacterized protein